MVSGWTVTLTCSTIAAPAETQPFRPSPGTAACFLSHAGHPLFRHPVSRLGGRQMPEVPCSLDRAGLRVIDVLLHVVGDGEQALRFLRRTGEFTGAPRPGLILLDLNLPRRNGLEVLAELKADPDLLTIPVVIFSTSRAETDIAASYQLHANAYITKPVSLDLFTEAIRQVDDFFLTLVKLPAED